MTKSKFHPKQNQRKDQQRNDRVKKKKKLSIVFDPAARTEYLTGFQKRKQEKKARYRTHLEKKLAAEKSRLKEQAKKSSSFRSSSHSILPEVENLLADQAEPEFSNTTTHEIGSTTVTISTIDTLHPIISEVGNNSDEDEPDDQAAPTAPPEDQAKMMSMLKKQTNQLLQRSKVFKAVQKLKLKKAQRKQRQRSTGSAPKKDDKKSGKKKDDKKSGKKKDDKGKGNKVLGRSGKNKKGKKK